MKRPLNILNLKIAFIILCVFMISAPTSSKAQFTIEQSSSEEAFIAFYKTGGTIPNFEGWIKSRAPYNIAPWAMREQIYEEEQTRLVEAFENFKPAEDFLKIRSKIKVDFEEFQMKNPETGVDEKHIVMKSIFFNKGDATIYFPYEFMDQYIALVPDNIEKFTSAIITKEEFDYISKNVTDRPTVYIEMVPFYANLESPENLDGQDQWALHTKVVSYLIINPKGSVIWEKTAPWYVSPRTKSLNKLYEGQYR